MTKNIAFIFPGQGSQKLGMLAGMEEHEVVVKTYQQASVALGYDVWKLTQEDADRLSHTEYTQPALLTASVALWRLWCERSDLRPQLLAGHSLGEYSALVCAESIAFSEALKLVQKRGQLMQEAVPRGEGAMAAILGLDDEAVIAICEQAADGEVAAAVNFNTPGQVVIAGHKAAVDRACLIAKEQGAKRALPLPVSVPSHCALMKTAAQELAKILESTCIEQPKIPVIHNFNVEAHESPEAIRKALVEQLYQPVRWVETIRLISGEGVGTFVECGPGKVLAGLGKRIVANATWLNIESQTSLESTLETLS